MNQEVLDPELTEIEIPFDSLSTPDSAKAQVAEALTEEDPDQKAIKLGRLLVQGTTAGISVGEYVEDVLTAESSDSLSPASQSLESAKATNASAVDTVKRHLSKSTGSEVEKNRRLSLTVDKGTAEVVGAKILTQLAKDGPGYQDGLRTSARTPSGPKQNNSSFRSGRPVDPSRRK